MAQNNTLELSIKIAGKVDKSLMSAIQSAQSSISGLSASVSRMGTAGLAAMGAIATGTATAIAQCTSKAATYKNYMADVVKYVDGLAQVDLSKGTVELHPENYEAMKNAVLDLSTQIPYTQQDLTRLAAAAGEAGKNFEQIVQYDSAGNVTGFLRNVAKAGTAMDVSADQAGDWAAKWETAFNMSHEEIMVLFDQINYLGAHSATTAAEIAHAVNEAASLGQIGGVDVATTTAMATAMLSTGVSMDVVGTTLKRVFANMTQGESATKRVSDALAELGFSASGIARAMQVDGSGTLLKIFNAIDQMPEERQLATLGNLFGQWAIEGTGKMVGNLDAYLKVLNEVNDPSKYTGSMEKEFIIKATTPEAVSMMRDNAWTALQIEFGTAFLPAQKEINLAMIGFLNTIRRNMPELEQLSQSLAGLASTGVEKLGIAMEHSLPHIQRGLDYLVNNGDQVASVLGGLAAAFAAMKLAPAVEGLLTGAGGLLFGSGGGFSGGGAGKHTGGLLGGIGRLFKGGQKAAVSGGELLTAFQGASASNGVFATLRAAASSLISGNGVKGTAGLLQTAAGVPGFLSGYTGIGAALSGAFANSRAGTYFGGVKNALHGVNQTKIGGALAGASKATLGTTLEILSGISNATGLTDLGRWGSGVFRGGVGKVKGLAGAAAGSKVGRAVGKGIGLAGTGLGHIGAFAGKSFGLLKATTTPMIAGVASMMAGLLPAVGVLSIVIASVSLLSDKFGGLKGILDSVRGLIVGSFGEEAGQTFDGIAAKVLNVSEIVKELFAENGVAKALSGVRDWLFGTFDPFTESYMGGFFTGDAAAMLVGPFDGAVTIVQSVIDVLGQLITFSIQTVKPMLESVFQFIGGVVVPSLLQTFTQAAPIVAQIVATLGGAVMTGMQMIGAALEWVLPIVGALVTAFLNVADVVMPILLKGFLSFSESVGTIMESIQGVFSGLMDFLNGTFSGDWSLAWDGIVQIFGNAFDGLKELCKVPINAVITLINAAIAGVNALGITIPEWVPELGGKTFGINIPELPMLARGGFTRGVSIAGEAGTEAVISFLPSVRGTNINTWVQAGRMLGVDSAQAAQAAGGYPTQGAAETLVWVIPGIVYQAVREVQAHSMRTVELQRVERPERDTTNRDGETITITYSPTLVIQGEADRDEIDRILREDKQRFDRWWEEKQRKERRVRFA